MDTGSANLMTSPHWIHYAQQPKWYGSNGVDHVVHFDAAGGRPLPLTTPPFYTQQHQLSPRNGDVMFHHQTVRPAVNHGDVLPKFPPPMFDIPDIQDSNSVFECHAKTVLPVDWCCQSQYWAPPPSATPRSAGGGGGGDSNSSNSSPAASYTDDVIATSHSVTRFLADNHVTSAAHYMGSSSSAVVNGSYHHDNAVSTTGYYMRPPSYLTPSSMSSYQPMPSHHYHHHQHYPQQPDFHLLTGMP